MPVFDQPPPRKPPEMRPSAHVNPNFDNRQHFLYDLLTRLSAAQEHMWEFKKEQSVVPPRIKPKNPGHVPPSPELNPVPFDPHVFDWLGRIDARLDSLFHEVADQDQEVWVRWYREWSGDSTYNE